MFLLQCFVLKKGYKYRDKTLGKLLHIIIIIHTLHTLNHNIKLL